METARGKLLGQFRRLPRPGTGGKPASHRDKKRSRGRTLPAAAPATVARNPAVLRSGRFSPAWAERGPISGAPSARPRQGLIPTAAGPVALLYPPTKEKRGPWTGKPGRLSGKRCRPPSRALIRCWPFQPGMGARRREAIRLDRQRDYGPAASGIPDRPRYQVRQVQAPFPRPDRQSTGLNKYLRLCGELIAAPKATRAAAGPPRGCRGLRYETDLETSAACPSGRA